MSKTKHDGATTGAPDADAPDRRTPGPETAAGAKAQGNPPDPDEKRLDHDTLAKLQQELEQAQAKVDENWRLYLGAQAEMDNLRKRHERELGNAHKYALEKFAKALLPVKDNLEMGISHGRETDDVAKLLEGEELTLKELTNVLEKFGVSEVDPLGKKFDPAHHEAMAMQPSTEAEPNTVLHVMQKGYLLNDRLIRPAMVIVAQAAKKPDQGVENPG